MRHLTTAETAAALGIHPSRVRRLAAARGVRGRKVGQAWLWPPSILIRCAIRIPGRPRKSITRR
jgi:hypothetical protein